MNSRLDDAGNKSETRRESSGITQTEQKKKKNLKKWGQLKDLEINIKHANIHFIEVPFTEGKKKKRGQSTYLKT